MFNYTVETQGGLKAVVWTDVLQTVIIIVGLMMATFSAIAMAGGLASVWSITKEHGRLNVDKYVNTKLVIHAVNYFISTTSLK